MTIKELLNYQKEFDSIHESNIKWSQQIDEQHLRTLEFLLISLMGELGETSNLTKKIIRGDFTLAEARNNLTEEITDVFIYLIKLIYQLDIDIENEYIKKMEKNKERFERYYINKE